MPDFKTSHASDNPHPEREEAKREAERKKIRDAQAARDNAELDKQRGREGAATHVEHDQGAIDSAAKHGAGPAGLNKGPSDTISRDPHNPNRGPQPSPVGGSRPMETGGMGFSPPDGAAPRSDRPAGYMPAVERGNVNSSDEAQAAADKAKRETEASREQERSGQAGIDEASKRIAENQSPGPADKPKDDGRRD